MRRKPKIIQPYRSSIVQSILNLVNKRLFSEADFRYYRARWKGIYGWLCESEASALFNFAKAEDLQGSIVEIGSAYGRSTVCLAWGARAGGEDKIFAVDPHTGDIRVLETWGKENGSFDSYNEFLNNMKRMGLSERVIPVNLPSEEAVKNWDRMPIRLVFVDGWHSYEAVKHDILAWSQFVVPEGIIVVHDFHHEGVRRALFDSMDALRVPHWNLEPVSKSMMFFRRP